MSVSDPEIKSFPTGQRKMNESPPPYESVLAEQLFETLTLNQTQQQQHQQQNDINQRVYYDQIQTNFQMADFEWNEDNLKTILKETTKEERSQILEKIMKGEFSNSNGAIYPKPSFNQNNYLSINFLVWLIKSLPTNHRLYCFELIKSGLDSTFQFSHLQINTLISIFPEQNRGEVLSFFGPRIQEFVNLFQINQLISQATHIKIQTLSILFRRISTNTIPNWNGILDLLRQFGMAERTEIIVLLSSKLGFISNQMIQEILTLFPPSANSSEYAAKALLYLFSKLENQISFETFTSYFLQIHPRSRSVLLPFIVHAFPPLTLSQLTQLLSCFSEQYSHRINALRSLSKNMEPISTEDLFSSIIVLFETKPCQLTCLEILTPLVTDFDDDFFHQRLSILFPSDSHKKTSSSLRNSLTNSKMNWS